MPEITVSINVPEFTEAELRKAIIHAGLYRVLGLRSYVNFDDDGERYEDIDEKVFSGMRAEVKEQASAAIKSAVATRVPALVDEELSREFQPMSKWGEPEGPPTTIRAMIGTYAQDWLTEKVDDAGNGRGGGYGEKKTPRLHWLVKTEVEKAFKGDLAKLAQQAAEEVKRGLAGKVGAEVTDTVRRLLGLPPA